MLLCVFVDRHPPDMNTRVARGEVNDTSYLPQLDVSPEKMATKHELSY